MRNGIHLRYLGEGLYSVKGVGVFQTDTVAFVPGDIARDLLRTKLFEVVTNGPSAQFVRLRIGQSDARELPTTRTEPEPADFERELEEEERRYQGS